jgi:uncharacterized protein
MRQPFTIGGTAIAAGARRLVDLPVAKLSNHTPVTLPVHVVHGSQPGPTMFVSAAIHGDELNGVEIIRRVLRTLAPASLSGTLLAVPIVNAYGFIGRSRYLPDRRDLNRSFPGSGSGSLAARIANLLMTEVVTRCQIGIDLHTAAVHRVNLPQIRTEFRTRARCRELALAFGAPVVLESHERAGSLRKAAREIGIDVLVYEGGEGLRFDEFAIQAGVNGIAGVMLKIGMLPSADEAASAKAESATALSNIASRFPSGRVDDCLHRQPDHEYVSSSSSQHVIKAQKPAYGIDGPYSSALCHAPLFANASAWVRAPEGGIFRSHKRIGEMVNDSELIGYIANPYEDADVPVIASRSGVIVGRTTLPIVNLGDALFHIAWSSRAEPFAKHSNPEASLAEPLMDEDEIL